MPEHPDPLMAIAEMVNAYAGIVLPPQKRSLVESRISKRLRELHLDADAYLERMRSNPNELHHATELLTTNHTAWLREAGHFHDLARRVFPALAARRSTRLRIWCAAASTGDEPYSIALTIANHLPDWQRWDCAILATDINSRVLRRVEEAIYSEDRIAPLSAEERRLALEPYAAGTPALWRVRSELRALVHPARLNLMDDWPMAGPFDVIFCRNVMIYFDRPTQQDLVNRMARLLAPGGTLYVGMSESLSGIDHPLRPCGPSTYTRM